MTLVKKLVLSGGSGTRLWPLSRTNWPKQFIKLPKLKANGSANSAPATLFSRAYRIAGKKFNESIISANSSHFCFIKNHLGENDTLITEEMGRNTAFPILAAALLGNEDDIYVVFASDHLINAESKLEEDIDRAVELAKQGKIVTFGITPAYPETGYGYIRTVNNQFHSFVEKPSADKAKEYCQAGTYLWNSGMFAFQAKTIIEAYQEHAPAIYAQTMEAVERAKASTAPSPTCNGHEAPNSHNQNFKTHLAFTADLLKDIESTSIDYAILEKAKNIATVKASFDWTDLGSFDALADSDLLGDCPNVIKKDTKNVVVNTSANSKQIVVIGAEDLIVSDQDDALMIVSRGKSQEIKEVVESLRSQNKLIVEDSPMVRRPWGTYEVLSETINHKDGEAIGHKVKRLTVDPGQRLSLQRHKFREEFWVGVAGTGLVTLNDEVIELTPGKSVHIKKGDLHRLENNSAEPFVIIETQMGTYLGEDDIERVSDDYNRH